MHWHLKSRRQSHECSPTRGGEQAADAKHSAVCEFTFSVITQRLIVEGSDAARKEPIELQSKIAPISINFYATFKVKNRKITLERHRSEK